MLLEKGNEMNNTSVKKPKQVRLSMEIDPEMHKELKHICINRNCTLKKLVLRAVAAFIRKENDINENNT